VLQLKLGKRRMLGEIIFNKIRENWFTL